MAKRKTTPKEPIEVSAIAVGYMSISHWSDRMMGELVEEMFRWDFLGSNLKIRIISTHRVNVFHYEFVVHVHNIDTGYNRYSLTTHTTFEDAWKRGQSLASSIIEDLGKKRQYNAKVLRDMLGEDYLKRCGYYDTLTTNGGKP